MKKNSKTGAILLVKVSPKASKNSLSGWENGELKVRLKAVPEKGAANKALIAFLAEVLDLPKSQLQLLRGETSRHKQILIEGKTLEEIIAKLKME